MITRKHTYENFGLGLDAGRQHANEPNEDSIGYYSDLWLSEDCLTEKGLLYVVADGTGDPDAGLIASNLAVQTMIKSYYQDPDAQVGSSLQRAMGNVNQQIYQYNQSHASQNEIGTTMVAAVFDDENLHLAHVGNSRAYLLRGNRLQQLTNDHTRNHTANQRHRGHLGVHSHTQPKLARHKLQAEDVVLLCSDGLWNEVTDQQIADTLCQYHPAEASDILVDLANSHGGSDNISLIVLSVDWLTMADTPPAPKKQNTNAYSLPIPAHQAAWTNSRMLILGTFLALVVLLSFLLMVLPGGYIA